MYDPLITFFKKNQTKKQILIMFVHLSATTFLFLFWEKNKNEHNQHLPAVY